MVESSGILRDADLRAGAERPYAQISRLALLSLALGVIGCLLVPIPFAVFFGIWAIRRIRRSKGAEVGTPAAVAGIVLALLLGAAVAWFFRDRAERRREGVAQSQKTVEQFFDFVSRGLTDNAFALLSPNAQTRYTPEAFAAFRDSLRQGGKVKSVVLEETTWEGRTMGAPNDVARSQFRITAERAVWNVEVATSRYNGHWLIDQITPRARADEGGDAH